MKKECTRKKVYFSLLTLAIICPSLDNKSIAAAHPQSNAWSQDAVSKKLLNEYYRLKDKHPALAKQKLATALRRDPSNVPARLEMGYLLDGENQKTAALNQFMIATRLSPNDDHIKLQIGYELDDLGRPQEARRWFAQVSNSSNSAVRRKAQSALKQLADNSNETSGKRQAGKVNAASNGAEQELNEYYDLKDKNRALAKQKLEKMLIRYPNNPTVHLEMGYLLDDDKQKEAALRQFQMAAQLNPGDYQNKLQVGYELDTLGRSQEARTWFTEASTSADPAIKSKAQAALINLANTNSSEMAGQKFTEIYTEPYYSSRFSEGVFPIQARIGQNIDEKTKVYFSIRATRDSRTTGGANPQVYDDNALIAGVGVTRQLKPNLSGYAEAGVGYDLVDMNRPRTRPDLRGGLIYYKGWHRDAHPGQNTGDIYGDIGYYSRYHNLIGNIRVRDGVNVLARGLSRVNVYLKGEVFADTERLYYNNRLEVGPGISYIPKVNRDLSIRLEALTGRYLGSFADNPYPSNYHDVRLSAEYDINF
jgi:Tfp pilus assembly protein PilF